MSVQRGTSLHGGSLFFSFHLKWSKLGTLLQTDANEADMKKKFKILHISHTGGSAKKIGNLNSAFD
jgi:hypothetical protein